MVAAANALSRESPLRRPVEHLPGTGVLHMFADGDDRGALNREVSSDGAAGSPVEHGPATDQQVDTQDRGRLSCGLPIDVSNTRVYILAVLRAQMTPEQLGQVRHELGLDQPVPVGYVIWLTHVVQGDLGYSTTSQRRVAQAILVFRNRPVNRTLEQRG